MQDNNPFIKIRTAAVIGLGYVGLPTASLLASSGIQTLGVDIDEKLVRELVAGIFNPREPGLFDLVTKSAEAGKLEFTNQLRQSDAYIIAVPTPIHEDKTPGMESVLKATESISQVIQPGQLVILESTSPPGATAMIAEELKRLRPDLDVSGIGPNSVKFAYCPERVLPGNALNEIVDNERLVGGLTEESALMAESLYSHFTKGTILRCTAHEAEMAKLVENSFRDVNIAFANEVARIATSLGVNADKVIALANRHPRVNILSPGVGVGGHCISVDPWFLVDAAPEDTTLIQRARYLNDEQPHRLAIQVADFVHSNQVNRVVCMGLSYKSNSDDIRESPSIQFVNTLRNHLVDTEIYAFDPHVSAPDAAKLFGENVIVGFPKTMLTSGDLALVLVNHDLFNEIDLGQSQIISIQGRGQVIRESI